MVTRIEGPERIELRAVVVPAVAGTEGPAGVIDGDRPVLSGAEGGTGDRFAAPCAEGEGQNSLACGDLAARVAAFVSLWWSMS